MDIKSAERCLEKLQKQRDVLLPLSRKAVADCAKAIREVHVHKTKHAKKRATKIRSLIKKLEKAAGKNPQLQNILATPYQEWVELEALLAIVEDKPLPKLSVPANSYVLGVLDAIGEGKRFALDLLMHKKKKDAARVYDRLEEIYYFIEGFSFPKSLVPGLKAKQDTMKRALENLYQIIVMAEIE